MNRLLIVLLLLLSGYGTIAQTEREQYYVIQDLQHEWLTIDENNRYVPFVARGADNPSVIGVRLDLAQHQGNQLRCCVPANTSILIDKQMLASVKKGQCLTYDIDSLRRVYQAQTILLTVYQPEKSLSQIQLQIVNDSVVPLGEENEALRRTISAKGDFFVIGLVVILILYAILINQYPRTFKNIYNLSKILSLRAREEDMRVRLVSEPHVVFLIQHCLLIAFLLALLLPADGWRLLSVSFPLQGLSSYLLLWLMISVAILAIVGLKYLIVVMFGSLFKLRHLMYLHMFDFMRLSLMFWGAVFLIAVCIYYNFSISNYYYAQGLTYLFVGFASARILVLYLRLFRNASFKNMYLFSYICTAEIIPLLVGLELLVGW